MSVGFAEFRSKMLEPAAAKKILKKPANLGISEKMVKFKYLSKTNKKQTWQVLNPGPRRAYKMFEQIIPRASSIAVNEILKTLGKFELKDFKSNAAATKSISLAMRRAGESVKKELIKVTPRGKARKSKLGLRTGVKKKFGPLVKSYEVVPAARFKAFDSGPGGIGVVVVARSIHAANVEEGSGQNQVLGTIKLDQNFFRKRRGRRSRKGRR